MNGLLLLLLSAALGQLSGTALHESEVAFAELPPECAAEYHAEIREFRKASATRVCRCDLDGDGAEELLVWTGESGSGGETWSVMTKRDGRWRRRTSLRQSSFRRPSSVSRARRRDALRMGQLQLGILGTQGRHLDLSPCDRYAL